MRPKHLNRDNSAIGCYRLQIFEVARMSLHLLLVTVVHCRSLSFTVVHCRSLAFAIIK